MKMRWKCANVVLSCTRSTIGADEATSKTLAATRVAQFSTSPAALVRQASASAALARRARCVSHLGLGDHAAANPGGRGETALRQFSATLSRRPIAGARTIAARAGRVERPRIL